MGSLPLHFRGNTIDCDKSAMTEMNKIDDKNKNKTLLVLKTFPTGRLLSDMRTWSEHVEDEAKEHGLAGTWQTPEKELSAMHDKELVGIGCKWQVVHSSV